jgi:hypothetical protein
MELLPGHRERIERLIGSPIREIRRARGGYSAAQRWILATDSGLRIFAKVGVPPVSGHSLRCEALVYERLRLSFMPRVLEWQDDPIHPILLIEDLSDYEWPPPWNSRASKERFWQSKSCTNPKVRFGRMKNSWDRQIRTGERRSRSP